jgi:hypothetical protein
LRVNAAHPYGRAERHHAERIAHENAPRQHGAGDHGTLTRQGKYAIHRQAKQTGVGTHRPSRRDVHQVGTQRRYARIIGDGGIECEQRRVVQRRGGQ